MSCCHDYSKGVGSINVITGPMFSSKSTTLISKVNRYAIAGRRCAILKWEGDTRYDDNADGMNGKGVVTHDGQIYPSITLRENQFIRWCEQEIKKADSEEDKYDVVGVDEGQFFKGLAEGCELLANAGYVVIVAGLVGTSDRTLFNEMGDLLPLADNILFLKAVCVWCKERGASFSKRICGGREKVLVGGSDKYVAVCRKCFNA